MPVSGEGGSESPAEVLPVQALENIWVSGDVVGIVAINETTSQSGRENEEGSGGKQQTDKERGVPANCFVIARLQAFVSQAWILEFHLAGK
jgi:hypothetical protein